MMKDSKTKALRHAPKFLVCLLLASMMLMMLAGCGANADGTYKLYKISEGGKEYSLEDFKEQYGMDLTSMFELEIKGTSCSGTIMGEKMEGGTAKVNGSTITITFEGDSLDCGYDAKEGTITMTFDGESAVLKKQ